MLKERIRDVWLSFVLEGPKTKASCLGASPICPKRECSESIKGHQSAGKRRLVEPICGYLESASWSWTANVEPSQEAIVAALPPWMKLVITLQVAGVAQMFFDLSHVRVSHSWPSGGGHARQWAVYSRTDSPPGIA